MPTRTSSYFFFILLLVAAIAAGVVFVPFLTPLFLAVIASVVAYPLYGLLIRFMGNGPVRKSAAALVTVVVLMVLIVVPLIFLAGKIYSEVQSLYTMLIDEGSRSSVISSLNTVAQGLSDMVFGALPAYSFDSLNVTEYLKSSLEWVFANLDNVFSSAAKMAGYALVFVLATFYFLRDGRRLKRLLMSWSPLLNSNDRYITLTLKRAIHSVFIGNLSVAVMDGISIGLAFLTFGIPAPALWGTFAAIAALVPGIGMSLIVLPAAAYLYVSGNIAYCIGVLVWGYATVFVVDHIIGPSLLNKGINIHPFVILLSVLGGLAIFGIVGFLVGPLVIAVLVTLLEVYKNSQSSQSEHNI